MALFVHIAWNSGLKDGLRCSRLKVDSSDAAWPTRAMAPTLFVSISLVSA